MNSKMNDIMKVLTIFAAIFIPLTFITGIYGMNFDYFPEIHMKYAYLGFWVLIVLIAAGMLLYFKIRKWF
ncbi:MAG: CorA family divalent cation transporter [Bacteroidota bacterium]